MISYCEALRGELRGTGVQVITIAPGYVDTEMVRAVPPDVLEKIIARIPRGRLGKAEDIARGVVFLTAEDADFITGSTLSINGGQHSHQGRNPNGNDRSGQNGSKEMDFYRIESLADIFEQIHEVFAFGTGWL